MIAIKGVSESEGLTIGPIFVDKFFTGKKKEYVSKEIRDLINSSIDAGRTITICAKDAPPYIGVHGNLISPKIEEKPIELPEKVMSKVNYLIRRGERIAAIKEVQNTNLFSCLSECRDFVLDLCKELKKPIM